MVTSFATSVLVARWVGPDQFGEIGLLTSLISVASIAGAAAIGPILSVRVAEERANGNLASGEIGSGVALSTAVGLAFAVAVLVAPPGMLGIDGDPMALLATGGVMSMLGFTAAMRFALQGLGRAVLAMWIWSVFGLGVLVAVLLANRTLTTGTYMVLYLFIQAAAPGLVFAVLVGRRTSSPSIKKMARIGILALPVVLWGVSISIGQVVSRRILIDDGAGVFQAASLLQQPFATGITALGATFLPALGTARVKHSDRGLAVTTRVVAASIGIAILLAGLIVLLAPAVIPLLLGVQFAGVVDLAAPAAIGGVFLVGAATAGHRLIADRRTISATGTAVVWLVTWALAAAAQGNPTPLSMTVAQALAYGIMAVAGLHLIRDQLAIHLSQAVLAALGICALVAAFVDADRGLLYGAVAVASGSGLIIRTARYSAGNPNVASRLGP
jgi:O-antigen/teichoic acid export membrane protein